MTVKLINRMGMTYILTYVDTKVKITTKYQGKEQSISVDSTIDQMVKAWFEWTNGMYIQTAFHFLNADEREFLMTGITKEEWETIFGAEE